MFKRLLLATTILIFCSTILPAQPQQVTTCDYVIPPQCLRSQFQSVFEAKQIVNSMLDTIER